LTATKSDLLASKPVQSQVSNDLIRETRDPSKITATSKRAMLKTVLDQLFRSASSYQAYVCEFVDA
jgi:hypothetical protein